MDKDLKKILETLGVEDGDYYINDDGRVKKRGILLDEDTGIYQTKNGEFKKDGILFDENTGLKQNERGEFKEEGILFDKDTGIYQDKDGNYRKKGILIDERTGYYKDKHGNIKKEGLFGSSSNIKTNSSSSKNYSPPEDDVSVIFFYMKWAFIIGAAIFVIVVAVFLAPLILLIWYLIKKRETQWIAIVGILASAYLTYDILSGGFITNSLMHMQRTGEEKYIALGYFAILAITLGFFLDKYTSEKIPVSNNGNFFEQKNIKERRPLIAGFSLLLLVVFSIFQFVSFSSNNSNINNSNYNIQTQDTNSTNTSSTSNSHNSFNNGSLIGKWNISNKNNSFYNFNNNGRGDFTNSSGKRFDFDWSIPNSKALKIKLDIDNSIWNWNIESYLPNKIIMYSQQHNERRTITKGNISSNSTNNSNNNIINANGGELAVISDSDGYTNLRKRKGTNYDIVQKIYSNDKFTVYPSNNKWWKVKLSNGKEGYIFNNRVDLINKEFYIINVTATKTETKALSEVKKLKNKGYNAGHLWIPNYKSLSGAKFYSVYIGPFSTQQECEREVEKYRKINSSAYGTLVSQENKRVEIRGSGKVKTTINSKNGVIKGTNVIIRDGYSTQSKIIGSFKNSGERVLILDSYYPNNSGETLIGTEINVRTNNGTNYNLQKGKSVTILSRQNGNVKIQFKDKELRNLTTSINESYLDKSVNSKWYKVKRNSGEIGWVFGKFINL
jgi:hypothetical protein